MVYKVYDNEEFDGASRALTAVLAQLPTQSAGLYKTCVQLFRRQ